MHSAVFASLSTGEALRRFNVNVGAAPHGKRVHAARTSTVAGLSALVSHLGSPRGEREWFDLVYVDAGHLPHVSLARWWAHTRTQPGAPIPPLPQEVLTDAVIAWRLLKVGGLMLFDDFKGAEGAGQGISAFLWAMGDAAAEIVPLRFDYQLLVRRIS